MQTYLYAPSPLGAPISHLVLCLLRSPEMESNVPAVYTQVVEDVINKVRDEFTAFGAGEGILSELQALWEAKMVHCGIIRATAERSTGQTTAGPAPSLHDLNVPYEGAVEEYETPTAEMLFPPTPLSTSMPQTPLPGVGDQLNYNTPNDPSDYASSPISEIRNGIELQTGRPVPYMPPPSSWMNQRPLGAGVNVAYLDRGAHPQLATQDFFMTSGKRKRGDHSSHVTPGYYLPQQDGSSDMTLEVFLPENLACQVQKSLRWQKREIANSRRFSNEETKACALLPQQDGVHDEYDLFHSHGVATEDYNTPGDHVELQVPTPAIGTPRPSPSEAAEDDEPPLNEDDDDHDDLVGFEQGADDANTQNLVLAQFDKVSRTKSKWKCTLKDGIMHLKTRDILFSKATGEFDF